MGKIKDISLKVWSWLTTNHHLLWIIVGVFFIYVMFFDRNSMLMQIKYQRQINQADREIQHYKQTLDEYNAQMENINVSDHALEEFARERYYMKATNEDIFIVEED